MKLDRAIEDVQDAEAELARQLRAVGERHAVEHDLYHLSHTLARQCAEHVRQLVPFGPVYGAAVQPDKIKESSGVLGTVRQKAAEVLGHVEETGLLLLRDLRHLYLAAQDAEIRWVILVQAARAVRDRDLLQVASACHEQAEARGKWLRTRIKETSPQVLATG